MTRRLNHPRTGRTRAIALALAGLALLAAASAGRAAAPAPARLVAVADIHGALGAFQEILRAARLIDERDRWIGGDAILVQTGDYLDRGADVRAVMDLLMALERGAPRAGGRAHVLLGNHETMNLVGETRDVNPEIYTTFADRDSEKRRERAWNDYTRVSDDRARALGSRPKVYDVPRETWLAARPPGFVEYLAALGPDGRYGRWLRERPVVMTVDGTVLMHAGLDPDTAPATLEDVNQQVRGDLEAFDGYRKYLVDQKIVTPAFTLPEIVAAAQAEAESLTALVDRARAGDQAAVEWLQRLDRRHLDVIRGVLDVGQSSLFATDGPMWFRGFANWSDAEGAERVDWLLDRYHARRFVAGHTPQLPSDVGGRFGGRVFLIDTGMLASRYPGGRASALEVADEVVTAIYADSTTVLARPSR